MDNENSMNGARKRGGYSHYVFLFCLQCTLSTSIRRALRKLQMALRWKVILTALNTKCRGIRNTLGKWLPWQYLDTWILPWQCLDTWILAFEFYCDVFTIVSCLFCTFTMYSDIVDMRTGISMLYEEHFWFIVNQRDVTVDNIVCVLYVLYYPRCNS